MGRVYLVGSSHVSASGADQVVDVIHRVRPDVVAVELCYKRYHVLREHGGAPPLPPFREGIREIGVRRYLLVWFLSRLQEHYARLAGAPVGTDMLHALNAAAEDAVPIALVDDDIDVTLERLVNAVGLRDVFTLIWMGAKGDPWVHRFDITSIPEDDLVEEMLEELERAFPAVYDVLVRRRNLRIASRLMTVADARGTVLAVLGAGHKRGVAKLLKEGPHTVVVVGPDTILPEPDTPRLTVKLSLPGEPPLPSEDLSAADAEVGGEVVESLAHTDVGPAVVADDPARDDAQHEHKNVEP